MQQMYRPDASDTSGSRYNCRDALYLDFFTPTVKQKMYFIVIIIRIAQQPPFFVLSDFLNGN